MVPIHAVRVGAHVLQDAEDPERDLADQDLFADRVAARQSARPPG